MFSGPVDEHVTLNWGGALDLGSSRVSLKILSKIDLQNRCPKEVQYNRQASQNNHKFMKNRARGLPSTIPRALLPDLVFERQYNEFHGFSDSGDSPNDQKSTQSDYKNRFETMYRKVPVQSTICIKK